MSSKPSSFIMTSDFATIKNDDVGTATVTMPGSVSVAGSGSVSYVSDITIGSLGGISLARIQSSKNSNKWLCGSVVRFTRTGVASGSPAPYAVMVFCRRTSATVVRLEAYISNPYSVTLTGEAGDEVFNLYISTYLTPFN